VLEVSLDCFVCERLNRTVVLKLGEDSGRCTPTGHPFPGRLLEMAVRPAIHSLTVTYRVLYRYEPFTDRKYPARGRARGAPTWARVSFTVRCPKCGAVSERSTQNNIVRPWTCGCACGLPLYTEEVEMPLLSWREVGPA
jgi:hypothetical protein